MHATLYMTLVVKVSEVTPTFHDKTLDERAVGWSDTAIQDSPDIGRR
jgi:hypothetical protein